jgi:hypothetical protein
MHARGGDLERGSLHFSGYSSQAHCTGEPAYLEPNSQSMQKTRREVGSLLVFFTVNGMLKNRHQAYLEPIRDSMQKPIGGRSVLAEQHAKRMLFSLYKGAIVFSTR